MLHVQFLHPMNADGLRFGLVEALTLDGGRLLVGGEVVATHRDNQWSCRGEVFTCVRVDGAVRVSFDNGQGVVSARHGPFTGIKLVDGTIRYGEGYHDLLAKLNEETGRWALYSEPGEWPRITLAAA